MTTTTFPLAPLLLHNHNITTTNDMTPRNTRFSFGGTQNGLATTNYLPTTMPQQKQQADATPCLDERQRGARKRIEDGTPMLSSHSGRAFQFVKKVLQVMEEIDAMYAQRCHQSFLRRRPLLGGCIDDSIAKVSAVFVTKEDMVVLAERLMETQDTFKMAGKPHRVDLAYHYTQKGNMASIQTNGLLTKKERSRHHIPVKENGSTFGDGIYTANNPFCFRKYGEVGLLVARLQGTVQWVDFSGPEPPQPPPPSMEDGSFDTVMGNKFRRYIRLTCWHDATDNTERDEVVLLTSQQCLPLLQYDTDLIPNDSTAKGWFVNPMEEFHIALQRVVDEFFNETEGTTTHF
jgi:hypothetical protein